MPLIKILINTIFIILAILVVVIAINDYITGTHELVSLTEFIKIITKLLMI